MAPRAARGERPVRGGRGGAGWGGVVEAGGVAADSERVAGRDGRAAFFGDKMRRGAKPADLPVELETGFELVLNLTTARTLGITFPEAIRLRADRLIE